MIPPKYKTERYQILPYQMKDEDRFVEMALDERSIEFMGGASGNEAKERALFQTIPSIYQRNDSRWFWLWGVYKDDVLCGHLELKETEHTDKDELEIVYMVHPEERRKGLMTEILALLKENQSIWKRRIIATTSFDNQNSIALLNKWGIAKREVLKDDETGKEYWKFTLLG